MWLEGSFVCRNATRLERYSGEDFRTRAPIVEAADPIEVIAFGSRARGDHRVDSDLDLAVIVDDEMKARENLRDVTDGIDCSVDLIKIGKARFDEFRPWINTVAQHIDREGVRLYERGKEPPTRPIVERLCERREVAGVRA